VLANVVEAAPARVSLVGGRLLVIEFGERESGAAE